MGTLPYTEIILDILLLAFSVSAKNNSANPSVIKVYNKEGGYLFTLIKERKVYMPVG